MNIARRDLLKSVTLGSGMAALTGCEQATNSFFGLFEQSAESGFIATESAEIDPDFHLLSRVTFGPWPGDLLRLKSMGAKVWLEEQLAPESINDIACDLRAERFESLYFSPGDAYEFRRPVLRDELTRRALLRAVYSRRQLFEVMVEFWTDHLNIDLEKGDCIYLKPSDDRDIIRKHALGNFYELIRASATSPAMLTYLDGRTNKVVKEGSDQPNENYARELMELHTMGVHGGYTQEDVREAARCLTGWTFDPKRTFAMNQNEAFFKESWHDNGEKTVLGHHIPAGGGRQDIDRLIGIVCSHASTAKYIALKLCRRFVSYTPPEELINRVAAAFTQSKGDIKSLLRTIFESPEFAASKGLLLKRPFRFVVSALRATAADTFADKGILEPLQRMGHGLFQYPTPDGYPDEELPWMGTLIWRWNFALALAANKQTGVKVNLSLLTKALKNGHDAVTPARWFQYFIGRRPVLVELDAISLTKSATLTLKGSVPHDVIGLVFASPAFQRH